MYPAWMFQGTQYYVHYVTHCSGDAEHQTRGTQVFNENGNGGKIEVDATVKIHTDSDLQMQDVVKVLENIMRRQRERRPPTTRNYALELPTFGAIAGVSPTEVQWKSLALGEPPW